MNLPDDDLKDFFKTLRAEDKQAAAPSFNGLAKRKAVRKTWHLAVPLGVAATVLLLFLCYRPATDTAISSSPTSVLVISLETRQEMGTESLLADPDPVSSWESPSASLIADF